MSESLRLTLSPDEFRIFYGMFAFHAAVQEIDPDQMLASTVYISKIMAALGEDGRKHLQDTINSVMQQIGCGTPGCLRRHEVAIVTS